MKIKEGKGRPKRGRTKLIRVPVEFDEFLDINVNNFIRRLTGTNKHSDRGECAKVLMDIFSKAEISSFDKSVFSKKKEKEIELVFRGVFKT